MTNSVTCRSPPTLLAAVSPAAMVPTATCVRLVAGAASAVASNTATMPGALPPAGGTIAWTPAGRPSNVSWTGSSQPVRLALKTTAVRLPRGTAATSRSCELDRAGGTETITPGSVGSTSIQ